MYFWIIFMKLWQCLICNGTLETLNWSKMWKILSFFSKSVSTTFPEKPQMKINILKKHSIISFLIRQSFQVYPCISGIAIFAGGSLEITLTVPLMSGKLTVSYLRLLLIKWAKWICFDTNIAILVVSLFWIKTLIFLSLYINQMLAQLALMVNNIKF